MAVAKESDEEYDLKKEVLEGGEMVRRIENGESALISDCIAKLDKAWQVIEKLGVFDGAISSADDVADTDLRCAFVVYYLSKALDRKRTSDLASRLDTVEKVEALAKKFMTLVHRLGILEREEERAWEGMGEPAEKPNAAVDREAAMAEYEKRKQTKDKRKILENRLKDGDDVERDLILVQLLEAAQESLHGFKMRTRELEMLKARLGPSPFVADTRPQRPAASDPNTAWLQAPNDGKGLRVIRVSSLDGKLQYDRDRIKREVFTPDPRRLPTISIEEAGEAELAEAIERERREKINQAKSKLPENDTRRTDQLLQDGDEDGNEDRYDAATKRDEAWDTWREHHPRGAGNKGDHRY